MSTTPRTRSRLSAAALALAGAGVLLAGAGLTACSSGGGGSDAAGSTAAGPVTVTVTKTAPLPAPTPAPTGGGAPDTGTGGGTGSGTGSGSGEDFCSTGMTGTDAVTRWGGEVPPNSGNYPWNLAGAETDGYDPCAALSWIILPIQSGTGSSPYQIMLFHDGGYLGTATSEAYGFHPDVSRVSDRSVSVTWTWPKDGESTAGASGQSTAQFTWDDATGGVAMSGAVPPE